MNTEIPAPLIVKAFKAAAAPTTGSPHSEAFLSGIACAAAYLGAEIHKRNPQFDVARFISDCTP